MKRSLRYISLILALAFIVMGTAAVVDAADAVDPAPADPAPVDPAPVDPEPVDPAPVDPEPADPGTGEDPGYVDPGTGEDPGYVDPGTSYDPGYDNDPLWYGDASDYDYNTGDTDGAAGSVADSTKLFDTSGTTEEQVAPVKWSNIKLDEKTTTTSGGSFSSIKSNKSSSNNTLSNRLLFIGYLMIALSVIGIAYFIIATVSASKLKQREIRHSGHNAPIPTPYYSGAPYPASRPAGHFADADQASTRRGSKADTGEIHVPRRAK